MSIFGKRIAQATLAISTIVATITGVTGTVHAAPVRTPIALLVLNGLQLPIPKLGWTIARLNGGEFASRLDKERDHINSLNIAPASCKIPADPTTVNAEDSTLRAAHLILATHVRDGKRVVAGLVPDSSSVESFLPQIANKLNTCSHLTAASQNTTGNNVFHLKADVSPIPAPPVEDAAKVYAYHGTGVLTDKNGDHNGAATVYAALVRDIWVFAGEYSADDDASELGQVFDAQVSKVQNAI